MWLTDYARQQMTTFVFVDGKVILTIPPNVLPRADRLINVMAENQAPMPALN